MAVYDSIGLAVASSELEIAKAMGVVITLAHRGGSASTLYATIIDQGIGNSSSGNGREIETGYIIFRIPVQTNFDVMVSATRPVTMGDKIVYGQRYLYVAREQDIQMMANGYIFLVKAIENKTLTIGMKS